MAEPTSVYIMDWYPGGGRVWGCRRCSWRLESDDNCQPEHRCETGPCRHRYVRTGKIVLQCCESGAPKPYATIACELHGAGILAYKPINVPMERRWAEDNRSAVIRLCETCPDFQGEE